MIFHTCIVYVFPVKDFTLKFVSEVLPPKHPLHNVFCLCPIAILHLSSVPQFKLERKKGGKRNVIGPAYKNSRVETLESLWIGCCWVR